MIDAQLASDFMSMLNILYAYCQISTEHMEVYIDSLIEKVLL